MFDEARKGTLEPGKLADLVVLSADLMSVPEDQIKDIKAEMTLVGGKVVFQR
jgi:predicted amidohydrolase YtcJ